MFLLDAGQRLEIWRRLAETIEEYIEGVPGGRVAAAVEVAEIRSRLAGMDFTEPLSPLQALDFASANLLESQVHTPHPRYFGLFNPAPTSMGIAGDALAAAFNPQLASWSHSPFAVEVERHLIRAFCSRFGYHESASDGTFCSGGAEANHTALLCALVHTFPQFAEEGLRGLPRQPVLYVSSQAHHSFVKAARFCGLGTNSVREVETDSQFRMSTEDLAKRIASDRKAGFQPFLVVATAGMTNSGVIDDLPAIRAVAAREALWFHTDAAWGGAAVFLPELRSFLTGIGQADSITFDAHKWLSVPMGAGVFLTRHTEILGKACRVTADYMPRDTESHGVVDPYAHSMQWSRRFIGLKVFLSLAVAGWEGVAETLRHQTSMGELLRSELLKDGWEIVNNTPLPVVCFRDGRLAQGHTAEFLDGLADAAVSSGGAWISTTRLPQGVPVLRACITNYRTGVDDVRFLVRLLNDLRAGLTQN